MILDGGKLKSDEDTVYEYEVETDRKLNDKGRVPVYDIEDFNFPGILGES